MMKTIQREILIPQPPEQVWQGIADSTELAEWMFPNDFEPRVGHRFIVARSDFSGAASCPSSQLNIATPFSN